MSTYECQVPQSSLGNTANASYAPGYITVPDSPQALSASTALTYTKLVSLQKAVSSLATAFQSTIMMLSAEVQK
jgi:hypothetical protein